MAQAMQAASDVGGANQTETSTRKIVGFITAVAVPVLIWFAPLHFAANSKHALAVAAFMIIAWIAEPIPHALTGLIGCYLFWVLKVVKFEVAFSGFADQTPWFLFGAGLFGMMATKTGLGRRLAYLIIRRVGTSYSRLLLGIILTSFLLTFLVPSGIACVVIMASVALGLMQVFGLGPGSNVGKGIFITLTYTAGCFDKMVIAGPSTILGRGLIEKGANVHI
jgi:solute carrier family 13 (sodium-dependent dicarboxylate transporter), member 2/3/5